MSDYLIGIVILLGIPVGYFIFKSILGESKDQKNKKQAHIDLQTISDRNQSIDLGQVGDFESLDKWKQEVRNDRAESTSSRNSDQKLSD